MATALINHGNLKLARESVGISASRLAEILKIPLEKVEDWESGAKPITFIQAQEFAKAIHIPFGFLYLETFPEISKPNLVDFRTVGDLESPQYSTPLRRILDIVQTRVDWMNDFLKSHDIEPNIYVGRGANMQDDEIINDISNHLNLSSLLKKGTKEEHNRELVKRIENLGIMVMRSSNAGNGHAKNNELDVSEFRGFAICDKYAPAIFINTNDAKQAQNFTLLHELTHIWLGQSGISDASPISHNSDEKRCNKIAAECLVPTDIFLEKWNNNLTINELAVELASHFKVSDWVIVRRALDLHLIDFNQYQAYIKIIQKRNAALKEQQKLNDAGGPNWHTLQKAKISPYFAKTVALQALGGKIPLTEAHRLTGIKPGKLRAFLEL